MFGRDIIKSAAVLLSDEDFTRWTVADLIGWLNEGTRAILLAKPSANAPSRILTLQQGSLQKVPAAPFDPDAPAPVVVSLIGLTRNLKTNAESPRVGGRVIRPVTQQLLDAQEPYWHDITRTRPQPEVRNYVFNEESPLEFYVYPPNDGAGIVEAILAEVPVPIIADPEEGVASLDDVGDQLVGLPDIYEGPLIDFVVSRAFAKDDATGNSARAAAHYQLFATAIGLKIQVEGATSANARRPTNNV